MTEPTPTTAPAEIVDVRHRRAWADYAAGRDEPSVAAAADIAVRTLRRWVAKWRATYGDALFRDVRDQAAAERIAAANTERHRRWIERTTAIESLLGDVSVATLRRLGNGIEFDPDVSVKDLAVIAGILIDKGQLVSGAPTSRAESRVTQDDIDRALNEMLADARDIIGD